jgi:electron transport complex protein RnfD
MWLVSLSAALGIVQSAASDSFASLETALAAVTAALITEYAACRVLKTRATLGDGSAVASALILTLLLPSRLSPLLTALGAVFAMAVVKHSFGGLGANWLNPALGGWLFVRVSWPAHFARALEGPFEGSLEPLGRIGAPVLAFLNAYVFAPFHAELPAEYAAWFFHSGPGIIADRGLFALLLGTILIAAFRASRVWIPAVFIGVYAALIRMAAVLPEAGGGGDMLAGLLSGGTVAAAFLLSADPATGAKSAAGAALGAALSAVFAFIFRYYGGEPLGAIFGVLLVNTLYPLIRMGEGRWFFLSGGPV